MKVPFSPPDITELEVNKVADVLKSGWITTGQEVKNFERKIVDYVGADKAIALSSATASLEAALHILGITEGDEVIVPAYTYTASASPVVHKGAKLVIIDSAPEMFEMDYAKVADAINSNTKAIIPVDIGGMVCDYDKLFEIVEAKKFLFKPKGKIQKALGRIAIISDGAHAFGSVKNNVKVGAISDFTSFSFHAVKNLTTGEGGALVWKTIEGVNNDEIYNELQLFSLHGQSKDALAKNKAGSWEYDIEYPAYKCNMTNINAAIGMAQLDRYDVMLKRRREINEKYEARLEKLGIKLMKHYTDEMISTGHLYLVRIPKISVEDRNKIIQDMAEREIACNVHYKPLPMMTAYKNLGFDIKDYPNAYHQYENLISLPVFSTMTDEQNEYVIENFVDILKKRGFIK